MKKAFLFNLVFLFIFSAVQAQTYDREKIWEKEIDAFAEIDRKQTPPDGAVLFVGSSSIRMWENLRSSFPRLKVINRGFGGSRLEDVNFYFERIVAPYKPKIIVLYAGENDINEGVPVEKLIESYRRFAAMVRQKLPKTKIVFVSLKPSLARWQIADKFRQTNALIKAETEKDKRAVFADVWTAMLDETGKPKEDIFVADRLHLNEKGYVIWRGVLEKFLK